MSKIEITKWRFDIRSFWIGLLFQAIFGPIISHVLHLNQLVDWALS